MSLTRIEGRIRPQGRSPIRAVIKLDGQSMPDSAGVFEYRTSGAYPVDRVNLASQPLLVDLCQQRMLFHQIDAGKLVERQPDLGPPLSDPNLGVSPSDGPLLGCVAFLNWPGGWQEVGQRDM